MSRPTPTTPCPLCGATSYPHGPTCPYGATQRFPQSLNARVLAFVATHPDATSGDVATALAVPVSRASRALTQMWEAGRVDRSEGLNARNQRVRHYRVRPLRLVRKWARSDRRRIYEAVKAEPWTASTELAGELRLPLATVSSHLAAMWRDGRMTRKPDGRAFVYAVARAA